MELLDASPTARWPRRPADGRSAVEALAALRGAVRRRVLRLAALAAGAPAGELFHEHVLAVDALVTDWHGQKVAARPRAGHGRPRAPVTAQVHAARSRCTAHRAADRLRLTATPVAA